jgi:predicted nucleic acid-binding Zn ribbon protein
METWKRYGRYYEASNFGNVRHIKHKRNLTYTYPPNGTPQVGILGHSICVSKIISSLFLGEKPDGYVIHHKDKNPSNNNIENLIYVHKSSHISEYHRKHKINHCVVCGKQITYKRKTCSKECHNLLIYEKRICKLCGKEFEIRKALIKFRQNDIKYKNGVGIYCSNFCKLNKHGALTA